MHESKDKFAKSIKEVEYLNSICKKETKYDYIFFKAIILLLSAKLEKFVKDSTKEYINELISYNVTNKNIHILHWNPCTDALGSTRPDRRSRKVYPDKTDTRPPPR